VIADDNATIRRVLRALIESRAGWQVCGEAENGLEAVAKTEELKPDLIVLDLAMPTMDGIRAAREISTASPALPILMHTMHSSPSVDLEAKKAGVRKVVSKVASGDSLLVAIEDLLNAGQPETVPEAGSRMAQAAAVAHG
jgi:DNA-binding NarL/FixJ family response regulator